MIAVTLVLALAVANSALIYFVIWDMLSPSEPYSVILFFISGSAHLIYLFFPWFIKNQLGPLFRTYPEDRRRCDRRENGSKSEFVGSFINFFICVGVALCFSSLAFFAIDLEVFDEEERLQALISEENCRLIKGKTVVINGRLICQVEQ